MGDVTTKIPEHREWVGQKGFQMRIRSLPTFRSGSDVGFLAAVEAHIMNNIDRLTNFARCDQFIAAGSRFGKIMIQITSKIALFARSQLHHLPGFAHIVGYGLFHKNMLAGVQCFHHRDIVTAAILIDGCRNIANFNFRHCGQHFAQRIKGRHPVFDGCLISLFFLDVTHRDQFGQIIMSVNLCMSITYATHADQTNFKCHFRSSSNSFYRPVSRRANPLWAIVSAVRCSFMLRIT